MSSSIIEKIGKFEKEFLSLSSPEEKYLCIIELGRNLPLFPESWKVKNRLVSGCQSTLYLYSELKEDKIFYYAFSDALISAGLAAILVNIYSGETPETILKTPPTFLHSVGIYASLSPNRSNGLANLHKKISLDALNFYASNLKN